MHSQPNINTRSANSPLLEMPTWPLPLIPQPATVHITLFGVFPVFKSSIQCSQHNSYLAASATCLLTSSHLS